MFYEAFVVDQVDSVHVSKAIAQFLRTMVSGNSRWDKWTGFELMLTPDELAGYNLFQDLTGADLFHCHPHSSKLFTDHSHSNNGMDLCMLMRDWGVNGVSTDIGKFKYPH